MSRVLMGFDYLSVVLVPQSEYLSTAIEYSPCNIKCFVSTPIVFAYASDLCKMPIDPYSMQYRCATSVLFNCRINSKKCNSTL